MNSDNLRNWLSSFVTDLRAKRLLPVIVLLLAAAIAIPLLLSHSGKAASLAPLPAPPVVTTPGPTSTATAVSERRHEPKQNYLTGPSHNPFITSTTASSATTTSTGAAATSSVAASSTPAAIPAPPASVAAPAAGTRSATGTGGSSHTRAITVTSPTRTTTVGRTTTVPAPPMPYSGYQVAVALSQAGVSSPPTIFHNLSRDQLLPTALSPFATFLGVRTDTQTAVFVLAAASTVTGRGGCAPSASTCSYLTLTPGQAATVGTPAGATFTLSYVKLHKVSSSASVVTVDPAGAADVKTAQNYLRALRTVRYRRYTGLLNIKLGSTVPVTR